MIKKLISEEELALAVMRLGYEISRDYRGKRPLLAVILKGSVIFAADLARRISIDAELDFMKVSSYGSGTDSSGTVTLDLDLSADIGGRDVIIVEDIVDTGLTMRELRELLEKRSPASLAVCSLLSKPSRRRTEVHIDYLGFEIPDVFAVGYGMDAGERYRNLPYIGVYEE